MKKSTLLLAIISISLLSACSNQGEKDEKTEKSIEAAMSQNVKSKLWEQLDESTWQINNHTHGVGETYVFYTDNDGEKNAFITLLAVAFEFLAENSSNAQS